MFMYETKLNNWFENGFKISYDFKLNYYVLPELSWSNFTSSEVIYHLEDVYSFILSKIIFKEHQIKFFLSDEKFNVNYNEIKFFLSDEKFNIIEQNFVNTWTKKTILQYMQDNYEKLEFCKISTYVEVPENTNPSFCFAIFYNQEWIDQNFYDFSIN